jgi:hypothetical protein
VKLTNEVKSYPRAIASRYYYTQAAYVQQRGSPQTISGSTAMGSSYGVLLSDSALFSINPLSFSDGNIMFVDSNPRWKVLDAWVG